MLDEARLLGPEHQSRGPVERLLYLKRLPLLAMLSGAQLGVVADQMGEHFFAKGSTLLREGEAPPALYFPIEGRVHLTSRGRVLGHAGPGLAVGPFHVLARDERGLGAVAETDTLTLELRADTMIDIFEDHFAILHHVIREVSRQIVEHVVKVPEAVSLLPKPRTDGPPTPARELDLIERIFFLRKTTVFTRPSISALAQLARGLTEVRLPAGSRIWREGEVTGWGSLIVSGTVHCTSTHGHDFLVGPGGTLGTTDAIAGLPRWFDAVTETPVVALQTNMQYLIDVFEDNFSMAMDFLSVQSRWLLEILDRWLASRERLERVYGCEPEAEMPPSAAGLVVAGAAAEGTVA
jgi:CRP-like cAMP-binding protein